MTAQRWDPKRYARNARFVAELGRPVVELLHPRADERVLDLGCGDGALTEKLVELGYRVVGVDSSPEQVEAARHRGLDARLADCRRLDFDGEFDAVFTNAVLHWVPEADAVIAEVARALHPGGQFVGEFGGAGNVTRIVGALSRALQRRGLDADDVNPWYFPTPQEYSAKLQAHGFRVDTIALIPRPTELPGSMVDWLETFAESFAAPLPVDEHADFLAEVQELLRPELCDRDGQWTVDYVRLRFAATLLAE